jgi:hypothetical protein
LLNVKAHGAVCVACHSTIRQINIW